MGDSIFRIRIQDKHDRHSWKVRAQLQQNRTLLEEDGIFHFEPEDFQRLKSLSLKDYGIYLGHALFQERLKDFFKSAFQSSQHLMKFALSVEVDDGQDANRLRSLHWERLCVPLDGSWQYLALDSRLPFGYHVPMGNLDRQYSPIQQSHLRGLIVIANPEDLEAQYGLAAIDVETTVQGIRAAFGDIPCDILANDCSAAVGEPTLAEVCDRLNGANPPYTLLHVISHGSTDGKGNTFLYWSDEQDRVEPIRGEYLVERLQIVRNLPHLIFLCCCSSASYYGSLAQNLIQVLGTPTVIAMTDKVSIKTGLELAENFYPKLLKFGEVDVALQQAAAPLAERPDITVPCLFSYRINRSLFGIQDDIIGSTNHAVQILASAASSTDGKINWSQYRPNQEQAIEPYKFLSYYETSDANVFFGRELLSEQLIAKITRHKLVLINGKSGSGKTSLVNAGLIPRLIERGYITMVFRDYEYPTEAIYRSLNRLNLGLQENANLVEYLRTTTERTGRPIAIFLDQFERFFLNLAIAQRKQFIGELKETLNQMSSYGMSLVISLREDFYGRLGEFWKDIPEFNTESYSQYLEPLNENEAKDAIEKPLQALDLNISYEPHFLNQVLVPNLLQRSEENLNRDIEPVHLQIVCNELLAEVQRRYSKDIKVGKTVVIYKKIYDELGGVEGILKSYFEDILNRIFQPEEQSDAKSVLKQMVTSKGTRIFKSERDIAKNLPINKKQVREILGQLDSSRFIQTIVPEDGSEKRYSITHEYLADQINEWYTYNELDLKRAKEIYERCLENWNDSKNRSCIPRRQYLYLLRHRKALLKYRPEGKKLFRESHLRYHGLNTAAILSTSFLVAVTGLALSNLRQAKINEARTARQASEVFFNAGDRQLESSIEVLKARQILQNSPVLQLWKPQPVMHSLIRGSLWKSFYQTSEQSRFLHKDVVYNAQFSPDNHSVVTVSGDGKAGVWTVNGKPLARLEHQDWVRSAQFSHDSRAVVTASDDKTAKVWDLEGKLLATLTHEAEVYTAQFSRDSLAVVTASADRTAKVWNLQGELLATLQHDDIVYSAEFNRDSFSIITVSRDRNARLWNIDGEELAILPHDDIVYTAQFSRNGEKILTISRDNTAKIWDRQGQLIATLQHQEEVQSAAFSRNSKKIITVSRDRTAKIWTADGQLFATLKHDKGVYSAKFSPNNQLAITISRDNTTRLWNTDGTLLAIVTHDDWIRSARFSPDSLSFVTASDDGTAKVWDLHGHLLMTLPHDDEVYTARFSRNAELIVTASRDRTAKVWQRQSDLLTEIQHEESVNQARFNQQGNLVITASSDATAKLATLENKIVATLHHEDTVNNSHFSPDGQSIGTASNDGTAKLWNVQGQVLVTLQHDDWVRNIEFNPQGDLVVTASDDGTAKIWNTDGELLATLPHEGWVRDAQFSPDGQTIVTASSDNTAKLWTADGKLVATLQHDDWVRDAQFSLDNSLVVTASDDLTAKVWDLNGELLVTLQHRDEVYSAKFSGDSQAIATTTADDRSAHVWDLEGNRLATLEHQEQVNQARFSWDSRSVVTASDDRTAKVWNLQGEVLLTLEHRDRVNSARFSSDGQAIVTASGDGKARVWPFPALSELTPKACTRVRNFLKYYPQIHAADRGVCDGVPLPKSDRSAGQKP